MATLALFGPLVDGTRKQVYLHFASAFTGFSGENRVGVSCLRC